MAYFKSLNQPSLKEVLYGNLTIKCNYFKLCWIIYVPIDNLSKHGSKLKNYQPKDFNFLEIGISKYLRINQEIKNVNPIVKKYTPNNSESEKFVFFLIY
jgi:hypothetical protein